MNNSQFRFCRINQSTLATLFFLATTAAEASSLESANEYFNKAIPKKNSQKSALTYHDIPINSEDPRHEEALVLLRKYGIGGQAFYARQDKLNAPYYQCICPEDKTLRLRKTVAEKLARVNKRLEPLGLELFVFDAYRPVSCQKELWAYSMSEAKRILGDSASQKELVDYAGNFCSNPTLYDPRNWKTWPTHLSGGAVDLTLARKGSRDLVFMGGIFDDNSSLSSTDHFEDSDSNNKESSSALEAKRNRRLLYWAMQAEGFANFPYEWWHFDYGNQMWVQNRQAKDAVDAFYGAVD